MMLMATEWHPFWTSYEWWRDVGTSGLSGLGGILVGVGAIVVAVRTHALAVRVRDDEQRRDHDAAQVRYREQVFRTVEPTITAMLDHRAELQATGDLNGKTARALLAAAITRLRLVASVTLGDDRRVVNAVLDGYDDALKTDRAHVVGLVLGDLMLILAALLEDDPRHDHLIEKTKTVTDKMIQVLLDREIAKSTGKED